MLYRIICRFLRIVFGTFYRWRVRGVEHLPERGGCVVVANHCNFADPLVLGSALYPRRIIRFMAKAEIFGWPILGPLVKRLHAFPVRRGAFDRQAVKYRAGGSPGRPLSWAVSRGDAVPRRPAA